jgi:hypothetical protein
MSSSSGKTPKLGPFKFFCLIALRNGAPNHPALKGNAQGNKEKNPRNNILIMDAENLDRHAC